jgi:hypothetical protein
VTGVQTCALPIYVGKGVGHRTIAESIGEAFDRVRVAAPAAVVNVGRLDDGGCEDFEKIVVFIACTSRRDTADLFGLYTLEFRSDLFIRVFPACLNELAVFPDERARETGRVVDELMGLVTANADLAFVHRVAVPWLDAGNPAVFNGKIDSAPGTAVGTGAWDILEIHSQTSYKNSFSFGGYLNTMTFTGVVMNIGG